MNSYGSSPLMSHNPASPSGSVQALMENAISDYALLEATAVANGGLTARVGNFAAGFLRRFWGMEPRAL